MLTLRRVKDELGMIRIDCNEVEILYPRIRKHQGFNRLSHIAMLLEMAKDLQSKSAELRGWLEKEMERSLSDLEPLYRKLCRQYDVNKADVWQGEVVTMLARYYRGRGTKRISA